MKKEIIQTRNRKLTQSKKRKDLEEFSRLINSGALLPNYPYQLNANFPRHSINSIKNFHHPNYLLSTNSSLYYPIPYQTKHLSNYHDSSFAKFKSKYKDPNYFDKFNYSKCDSSIEFDQTSNSAPKLEKPNFEHGQSINNDLHHPNVNNYQFLENPNVCLEEVTSASYISNNFQFNNKQISSEFNPNHKIQSENQFCLESTKNVYKSKIENKIFIKNKQKLNIN